MTDSEAMTITQASELLASLRSSVNTKLIGQQHVVDLVLISLLANGHVLLEGVPGLGKTLLVQILASSFDGSFKRIQFTPDLMPADITGHVMFDMEANRFRVRRGPVFTNLLLADEINRAPAKTQAALLEVMQERQVTLEGEAKSLPKPFMVLATQNPIEQEGTYPLPEAELDRFLLKVSIDYPSLEDEVALTKLVTEKPTDDDENTALLTPQSLQQLQLCASRLLVDDQIVDYAVRIVRATRESSMLARGAGSRAAIALVQTARAKALLEGRDFVIPDDIKALSTAALRHRVALSVETEIEGFSTDAVIEKLVAAVEAPRQ